MKNKILVLATHPDDETLGCGGTILKHLERGDEVVWMIATTAQGLDGIAPQKLKARELEIKKVSSTYKFSEVIQLNNPATKLDSIADSDLIAQMSHEFNRVKPNTIILPFAFDAHSDHRKLFQSAYSCTKSFRYPFIKKILMMETLSETEFGAALPGQGFSPNIFIDISNYLEKKIEIMKMYQGEMGQHPFPRSEENMRALATLRGATAGVKYAESFMLLKEIV